MVTQDQVKDYEKRVEELKGYLKIDQKLVEIKEDELKSQDPTFWDNPKQAEALMKKMRVKKGWVEDYEKVFTQLEDLKVLM